MKALNKKINLVLGGGGIRGVGHLPLLEYLEERNIQINAISGVSSGAIVAALYAAGKPTKEIYSFFENTSLFRLSYLNPLKGGFLDSKKFESLFQKYLPDSFEGLQIPITITATDLLSGKAFRFTSGKLIYPLIASCAFPVVLAPVEINGRLFTDGGVADNYPIAPFVGSEYPIIGHYIATPPDREASYFKSPVSVSAQANQIMLHKANESKFADIDLSIDSPVGQYWIFGNKQVPDIYKTALDHIQNHERLDAFVRSLLAH